MDEYNLNALVSLFHLPWTTAAGENFCNAKVLYSIITIWFYHHYKLTKSQTYYCKDWAFEISAASIWRHQMISGKFFLHLMKEPIHYRHSTNESSKIWQNEFFSSNGKVTHLSPECTSAAQWMRRPLQKTSSFCGRNSELLSGNWSG